MSRLELPAPRNAEQASADTLGTLLCFLDNHKNFRFEAGAGAGKTYSLVCALQHIRRRKAHFLPRSDQRVACLTYTRVARDEIKARTDDDPAIFTDTLHGFLWEMIHPYQKALSATLPTLEKWEDLFADNPECTGLPIEYSLGIRSIDANRISLHHEDIPALAIQLFQVQKFRSIIADRFPVIFVDEYQDTPAGLAEAILCGYKDDKVRPILGFFGDHWQQIYRNSCGSIDGHELETVTAHTNFRSDRAVVSFLNGLRPELPQAPHDRAAEGSVSIYHTNDWKGARLTRQWKDNISHEATQACLTWLLEKSPSSVRFQRSADRKVLMLTHTAIAKELGYPTLPEIFRENSAFANKEDPVIAFLVDVLEPAIQAFSEHRYGRLFDILGNKRNHLKAPGDKCRWMDLFGALISFRETGTVGDVLACLMRQDLIEIPTRIVKRERELDEALRALDPGEKLKCPKLEDLDKLHSIRYSEVRQLRMYLEDSTSFSTMHSTKGAEFDDVVVLVGRGWSTYDFAKMIADHSKEDSTSSMSGASFRASRNLFYVASSRAKHNLTLLFVQKLEPEALRALENWAGAENIMSIQFDEDDGLFPIAVRAHHGNDDCVEAR